MNGEIEIMPDWDKEHAFAVMVSGRHRDAGYLAQSFPTPQRAIGFAEGMVKASNLTIYRADVVALQGGAR